MKSGKIDLKRYMIGTSIGILVGCLLFLLVVSNCFSHIAGIAIAAYFCRVRKWREGAVIGAIVSSAMTLILGFKLISTELSEIVLTNNVYLDLTIKSLILLFSGTIFGSIIGLIAGAIIGKIFQEQEEGKRFVF